MSIITDCAAKIGITDFAEISMLENFFQNPEITGELREAEKWRIRRYMVLLPGIILTVGGLLYLASQGTVQVEIGDTGKYRASNVYDGMYWSIFGVLAVFGIVTALFRAKIEGAIKQKILTKLSKELYSGLEYDPGQQYAFGDIGELQSKGFLNSYDSIDTIEDSLGFKIQKDGKYIVVQGYELETSKTSRDNKGRRRKTTTNHCYLLKARFPSARIPLGKDLFIRTDEADSIGGSFRYGIIGGIVGGILGIFLVDTSPILTVMSILIGVAVGYLGRRSYIDKHRVKLENIEFEKYFDVQCDDQVGSRMVVTPAFMDRLVTLAKNGKYKYELLYRSNHFYIKWNVRSGYLEVNTWKNMTTNLSTFLDWYSQMKDILSFVFDMRMLYFSKTEQSAITNDIIPDYEKMGSIITGKNQMTFFGSVPFIGRFLTTGK